MAPTLHRIRTIPFLYAWRQILDYADPMITPQGLRKLAATTFLLVSVGLLSTGCAGGVDDPYSSESVSQASEQHKKDGRTEVAEALADGEVTADEYDDAYWNLRKCLEDRGYAVTDAVTSPLTGSTFEFVYNDNGRSKEAAYADYEECENTYWTPVAEVYSATAPSVIEQDLKLAIVDCLELQGETVNADARSFSDLIGSGASEDLRDKASTCAQESAFRLYPDLPSLAVAFG